MPFNSKLPALDAQAFLGVLREHSILTLFIASFLTFFIFIFIILFLYILIFLLISIFLYCNNSYMPQKKTFSTRVDESRIKALKHLAVDTDKSLGVLLEEAIADLVRKYEKKGIKS